MYIALHCSNSTEYKEAVSTVRELLACQNISGAVERVQQFWESEWDETTPPGRVWRRLLKIAEDVPQPTYNLSQYDIAINKLQKKMGKLLRPGYKN
mmetsp:Transcript_1990/g.4395  ORF Transcript_1990/g.4395 Transcript_1990/m.4395 type:complete len:96 (+) Transcript_1990:1599-1886(+)